MTIQNSTTRLLSLAGIALVSALTLSACGSGSQDAGQNSSSSTSASTGVLDVSDPWIKAASSGMTAAFGKIKNTSDKAVTITSATAKASEKIQLHETVKDQSSGTTSMQEKKDGFTIDPGPTLELKPGGNHIMLMGLSCSLLAGDDLKVTLHTSDGQEIPFTAPIRDYQAAQEHYDPSAEASDGSHESGHDHSNHSGHEHSSMDHSSMDHSGMNMAGSSESALPSCSA